MFYGYAVAGLFPVIGGKIGSLNGLEELSSDSPPSSDPVLLSSSSSGNPATTRLISTPVRVLSFKQGFGQPDHRFRVLVYNFASPLVLVGNYLLYLFVDLDRRVFRIIPVLIDFAAKKDLLVFFAKRQRTEFTHSIFTNHSLSKFGSAFYIV